MRAKSRGLTIYKVVIAPASNDQIKLALNLKSPDLEVAMQISCVIACKANYLLTRNTAHYKKSPIEAISPRDFMKQKE